MIYKGLRAWGSWFDTSLTQSWLDIDFGEWDETSYSRNRVAGFLCVNRYSLIKLIAYVSMYVKKEHMKKVRMDIEGVVKIF